MTSPIRPRRALLGALAALLLAPATSAADTYTVFGCRGPAGTPNAATGWQIGQVGASAVSNSCATGGTLAAALSPGALGGSVARIRFQAPAGTRIVRLGSLRATTGAQRSTETLDATYELSTDGAILEKCALAADSACTSELRDPLDKQGLDAAWARYSVVCAKGGDEQCTRALRVDVAQVAVGLRDVAAPTVSGLEILDDGERSGVLRLRFDAADAGGGVYRAIVKVDGEIKAVAPLGSGACADALPADADPYQFEVPVPCPAIAPAVPIAVSAKDLPAGPHTLQVEVEDAAGNATTAYVTEFPRPNVASASDGAPVSLATLRNARVRAYFDRNRRTRYSSRDGRRVVIRGRLRDKRTGKGVVGARIDVYHLVGRKKRSLTKTGLKTREGGKLTLILPMDLDTRQIRLAYRALRPGRITSRHTLKLTVRDERGRVVRRVK